MVGLAQVAHRPIGEFSKGMTRRIGIAQALVNDPEFLILDEPTSGLDPIGTKQVKDLLLDLRRRGKTILLSSHLLADVEDVCDRMVMLYGGRIRAQGTADELLRDTARTVIHTPRLRAETIARIEALLEAAEGVGIESVEAPRQRLEQLFLDIVETARREQVETSGALHGGETAAFLRGDEEVPAGGEALIESLVRDEATSRAEAKTRAAAPAAAREREAKDVLAGLMREKDEGATEAKPAPAAASSGPVAAPEGADASVIDALVRGEATKGEKGGGSDEEGARGRRP
jgi:ABC-2 type transport system ATP-binding protein